MTKAAHGSELTREQIEDWRQYLFSTGLNRGSCNGLCDMALRALPDAETPKCVRLQGCGHTDGRCKTQKRCAWHSDLRPAPSAAPTAVEEVEAISKSAAYRQDASGWNKYYDMERKALDLARRLDEALRWKEMSVTEIAAFNQSVNEYCKHWEGRDEADEQRVRELEALCTRYFNAYPFGNLGDAYRAIFPAAMTAATEGKS